MYYPTGEKVHSNKKISLVHQCHIRQMKILFMNKPQTHKPLDDSLFSKIKFDQEAKRNSKVLAGGITCVDHSLGFRINDQSQHQ
mgnify:CR=1 FL=1